MSDFFCDSNVVQDERKLMNNNIDNTNLGLSIVATPIGNLSDISERAINTIKQADFIICENPKHSLKLLNKFGIKKKLFSLHDYNEISLISKIRDKISKNNVVLISDAGSPLISDPGYKLVRHCIDNKIPITTIPGPTSIIPALQLSGLSLNKFYFLGFLPKSKKQMLDFINEIKNNTNSCVFFVSHNKLLDCLNIINSQMKDRLISVSKELTKINETIFRGTSKQIIKELKNKDGRTKGEFVIVIEGNSIKNSDINHIEQYETEIKKMLSKFSLTDVVEIVHKLSEINKNKIYKWVLDIKNL